MHYLWFPNTSSKDILVVRNTTRSSLSCIFNNLRKHLIARRPSSHALQLIATVYQSEYEPSYVSFKSISSPSLQPFPFNICVAICCCLWCFLLFSLPVITASKPAQYLTVHSSLPHYRRAMLWQTRSSKGICVTPNRARHLQLQLLSVQKLLVFIVSDPVCCCGASSARRHIDSVREHSTKPTPFRVTY